MYHPVVDQLDEEALATIYPALDETFNTDGTINVDVGGDGEEEDETKNYEFGLESVEEFFNVFQNCGDPSSIPDCPEFAAELTTMNSFCKTRWNGTGLLNQLQQWMLEEPQYADENIQHQQQKIAANIVLDAPLQRLSDSSASSQAQEDVTIYSSNAGPLHIQQQGSNQQQIHLPLIPITTQEGLTEVLRNDEADDSSLPTSAPNTKNEQEGDVSSQDQPLDLTTGQPQQPSSSHLIPGVNEDGSLIFDVDAGRTSPRSLQFLFQLPNVQQQSNLQQQQQPQAQQVIVKNNTISSNSVDVNCQQKNVTTQPNLQNLQQEAISYNYQQLQQALATQQVQVATQTQQQLPTVVKRNDKNFLLNVSESDTQNLAMEVAQQMQQQNINMQQRVSLSNIRLNL